LVLQFAKENRSWGYRRIVGTLNNLGHAISHQTVANILRRHGLSPAPEREKKTTWREFIRAHTEVLAAVDFFTAEVWTLGGLMTYYVLAFMRIASREVSIAGITTSPDLGWMEQMARNVTQADIGFLSGCRYLLHDRDTKFCAGFDTILESVGIQAMVLPPRSPNLNSHASYCTSLVAWAPNAVPLTRNGHFEPICFFGGLGPGGSYRHSCLPL
jgi:putative transposase